MKDFIDLEGASGARYRFRLWPEGAPHTPVGGNYVYVRSDAEGVSVLEVGETNDLSRARAGWAAAERRGANQVMTRLNVSRAVRAAEHADLAARYADSGATIRGGPNA
jgi:hypothetical protein